MNKGIVKTLGLIHTWRCTQLDADSLETEFIKACTSIAQHHRLFRHLRIPDQQSIITLTEKYFKTPFIKWSVNNSIQLLRDTLDWLQLVDNWDHLVALLLSSISYWQNDASLGMKLLGLSYDFQHKVSQDVANKNDDRFTGGNGKRKKLLFWLMEIVLPHFKHSLSKWLQGILPSGSFGLVMQAWSAADLVNWLMFLRNGQYMRLSQRILGIQVRKHPIGNYGISYDYCVQSILLESLKVSNNSNWK